MVSSNSRSSRALTQSDGRRGALFRAPLDFDNRGTCLSVDESSYLEIGWLLNADQHPTYWKKKTFEIGCHSEADLFRINPTKLKRHALVFAQSGGGKSFFVGRLIEELCTRTRAKCVVFDPNSDYSKVDKINRAVWDSPTYDDEAGTGALPTETTAEQFESKWTGVKKQIWPGTYDPFDDVSRGEIRLNVDELSASMFARQGSIYDLIQVEHCLGFANLVLALEREYGEGLAKSSSLLVRTIDDHLSLARRLSEKELNSYVFNEYGDRVKGYEEQAGALRHPAAPEETAEEKTKREKRRGELQNMAMRGHRRIRTIVADMTKAASFVGEDASKLFVGRLYKLLEDELLYGVSKVITNFEQLNIVDLPAYDDDEKRLLVVGAVLSQVWAQAREAWEKVLKDGDDTRVPTFLIVDEAHNLIPTDAVDAGRSTVREQFRRVAAEGRKLGLFLILITQRPDKLDPMVVSECENKMIMRVGSRDVLEQHAKALGFAMHEVEDALRFKPGRAICVGPWATVDSAVGQPKSFYCAARRTLQGGKDLDDEYWTNKQETAVVVDLEEYDPFADLPE